MNRTARLIAISALALTLPLGLAGCNDDQKSVVFGTSSSGAGAGASAAPVGSPMRSAAVVRSQHGPWTR